MGVEMRIENKLYNELKQYVKDNYGFGSALKDTELYKKYLDAKESLRVFDGKKVKISFSYTADFMGGNGFKIGNLKFKKNDKGEEQILFYDGLNRSRYNYLDFGLFDGFYAVLIIKTIEDATKEEFKQYIKEQKEKKLKRRYGF